jgi:hypothetical protein
MIGHDHVGVQFIMCEINASLNGLDHERSDGRLAKLQRTAAHGVEVAIHPNKCLTVGEFSGPGRERWWKYRRRCGVICN